MSETSQSITKWAQDTFGVAAPTTIAIRAMDEMVELLTVAARGNPFDKATQRDLVFEVADVVIVLHQICGMFGYELTDVVDEWVSTGPRVGQHTE
jgi:NTP pyrophosphatase (non-canonical NTP hydrolase)